MGKILILSKYIFLIYSVDIGEIRRHIHVTIMLQDTRNPANFGWNRKSH